MILRAPGPLPQFAKALIPGVKSTGPMIDASLPFITQLRYLVSPQELRGLTADLAKTVPALARLTRESTPLMANGVRPAASCAVNVVIPWSQLTLTEQRHQRRVTGEDSNLTVVRGGYYGIRLALEQHGLR